jgi:hypothetical protein
MKSEYWHSGLTAYFGSPARKPTFLAECRWPNHGLIEDTERLSTTRFWRLAPSEMVRGRRGQEHSKSPGLRVHVLAGQSSWPRANDD